MRLPLLTPAAMAERDRATIDEHGVPGLVLMESAASACVRVLLSAWPDRVARGVFVLGGPGNNGADGLAIARRLAVLGVPVRVHLPLGASSDDARVQERLARSVGVEFGEAPWPGGVSVDALFGTGLSRPIEGALAAALERLEAPILAVDIPSGVDGSTGRVLGAAVPAQQTVTFGAAKRGHLLHPGRSLRGDLVVADIGVPIGEADVRLLDADALAISERADDAHKGSFGHLLVVAGSEGKVGAARLTAEAALRAGAGLVTLCVPAGVHADSLAGLRPEVMVERAPSEDGVFAESGPLLDLLATRDALAVGPGLGAAPRALLVDLLAAGKPTVVDADGLNALGPVADWPAAAGPRVLTPHPGEAGRLLGCSTAAVQEDRIAAAQTLSAAGVAVLKGASTVISGPGGTFVNPTGNPGLATGGSGDVLTGIVGALLARGLSADRAAAAAVYWHGAAADVAVRGRGEASLVAGDVIDSLGQALLSPPSGHDAARIRLDPEGWRAR